MLLIKRIVEKLPRIFKVKVIAPFWKSYVYISRACILVYIARWTSVISEEVCDMGSYRTRRQPSVIRAHITHFFTYHTSPRVIYSLYHNNCPICLLFIEVLPKMSIKPSKTHEIKTWKITKYFCSVISYFGKTYHTLPQCDLDS